MASAASPGSPASGSSHPVRSRRRKQAVIESDPEDDAAMDTSSGKPERPDSEATSTSTYTPSSAATQLYNMDTDISKLEAPTFTTLDRGPSQPMLSLNWDHRLDLIGKKVVNPMIHCCDKCLKPILFYGRMIPCKHVFCLFCAKESEANSARSGKPTACGRCGGDVVRVEQAGLGSIHMCSHGGSRYGNDGCRRTYLSHRDLQAHIQHRHMKAAPAATAAAAPIAATSQTASLPATLPSAAAIAEVTQALIANANTSRSGSNNKHSSSSSYYGASSSYPSQSSRDSRDSSSRRSANSSANNSGRSSYPYSSSTSSGNGGAPSSSASTSAGGSGNTQPISVISSSRQSNLITVPIQDGGANGNNGNNASERTSGSSYGYSGRNYGGEHHHHHGGGGGNYGHQGGSSSSSSSWRTSGGHSSQQTSSSYYRR